MKILHVFPRQTSTRPVHVTIPKRFVYFWEIASYLSKNFDVESVDSLDSEISIFDLGKKVIDKKFDLIVLLVRVDNLRQSLKTATFLKRVSPSSKIVAYGDLVNLLPSYFKNKTRFGAVVTSGDWELSIKEYARFVEGTESEPKGVFIRDTGMELPGEYLGSGWSFPDPHNPMIQLYNKLNHKKQLSLTVSRGCPFNCRFCLSVKTFGVNERRKSVDEVVEYLKQNKDLFDSFKLFAPTFTVNLGWVKDFSKRLIDEKLKISWTATSRIDCLVDEEVVRLMAESGCYKISVGIETINSSSEFLKKKFPKETMKRVADHFNKYGIMLKGLIMLGVPGQTKDDIRELFCFMEENNIKIRPTSYSPLDELADCENLTTEEIERFDKLTYYKYGVAGLTESDYFRLILDPYSYKDVLKDIQ